MPLQLYNTLHREKEAFEPLEDKEVKLYTCGPTVYDYPHIGNMRAYVLWDVLRRYLEWRGYDVFHVMNITDVGHLTDNADQGEDKMEVAAERENKSAWEIAAFYIDAFMRYLDTLNIRTPHKMPRATEHIQEQIDLVQALEEKSFTYETSDGIYFNTTKLDDYGAMANIDPEELEAGKRVEMKEKKHPTDFALWKFSPEDEQRQMEWDSPWGVGFPGWHIECSVLAMEYLGERIDIHTGGVDHINVHHPNEIAQSEAATGKSPFAKYWLHNNFIQVEGEKMAKSKGNYYTLDDLLEKGFSATAIRYFLLSAHYRSEQNLTEEALKGAEEAVDRLRDFHARLHAYETDGENDATDVIDAHRERFVDAMDDDLNTPEALAAIFDFVRAINNLIDNETLSQQGARTALFFLQSFDEILGVLGPEKDLPEAAQELIEKREQLREDGKYEEADAIREQLRNEFSIAVQDTQHGPLVRFIEED